jgi:hypothetical protein
MELFPDIQNQPIETRPETSPKTNPETSPETCPETSPETFPETSSETSPETIPNLDHLRNQAPPVHEVFIGPKTS